MKNIVHEFHHRLETFISAYEEEEVDTFVRSLVTIGDMVEAGFGAERAAQIMSALEQVIIARSAPEAVSLSTDPGWRDRFRDMNISAETDLPLPLVRAQDLNAFAYFGILASWDQIQDGVPARGLEDSIIDVPRYVEDTIALLERFMGLFGGQAESWGFGVIERTILAARARLNIDRGTPLSVHELAALTRVIPKRLQNAMYAKSDEAPITNAEGLIPPASAARWLENRDYLPSIWESFVAVRGWEQERDQGVAENDPADTDGSDDFVFVPEASDGNIFGPRSCGRGADGELRYTIGNKGDEQTFANYDEALAALTTMVVPRWRRPNPRGNYGIVRAERWRRVSRRELASF